MTDLRQAEPTPWRDMVVVTLVREGIDKHKARELADHFATPPVAEPPAEWPLIKNILAEYGLQAINFVADWKAAQRPWVGLTDEEILRADPWMGTSDSDINPYQILLKVRILEAKLKERNNGP